jgi:hypothetical protein
MQFRAEFFPKAFSEKINHRDQLMLIGSCFTEQIGAKLAWHKFRMMENPHGILFNPVSILKAIKSYIQKKSYTADELFLHNDVWGSWDHHTRFSSIDIGQTLSQINSAIENAHQWLKQSKWVFITLGSAFVYERKDITPDAQYAQAVANCHKIPTDKFNRRLMFAAEVEEILARIIGDIRLFAPACRIVFTISPVRHLREGFIENNRSKAALIQAVHAVTRQDTVFYFPAYELVIDDLRDYRFFAEDLAHPNYAATNYVWEKFTEACIDEASKELMKTVSTIMLARSHKPFNPQSAQHKKFLKTNLQKIDDLITNYPHLDFEEERAFFAS